MNGLEQVKTALSDALEQAGIATRTAYAPGWAKSYDTPVVAIGLRTGESRPGALSHYLGQRTDPKTLLPQEVYGLRLDLTLSLDVYAPAREGASGCDAVLEALHQLMLEGLPSGLKAAELKWEEAAWDSGTSMFLRRGSLSCGAYFTAAASDDGVLLTDFKLKGVMTK